MGDIIKVTVGMKIEFDAVLLRGFDVQADEFDDLKKKDTLENCIKNKKGSPLLVRDSYIAQGEGLAIVIAVAFERE